MDWILNDELGLTVRHLFSGTAAAAMVIGGIIPYVPQYKQIKQTQDADGFSLHVCLALLVANTLRILFWFSKRYELPLLVQSIVMNLTMFLMIHLCVKVKRNNAIMKTRDRVFAGNNEMEEGHRSGSIGQTVVDNEVSGVIVGCGGSGGVGDDANQGDVIHRDGLNDIEPPAIDVRGAPPKRSTSKHYLSDFDPRYFWAWTDFQSYLDFMLVFWAIGAAITYLMLNVEWFMETVGFVAVFTEALLGAPQFLRNFNNKSTHGMSIHMVVMWTLGDVFKTVYFVVREAPMQFWICGTLQVSLDFAILLQVYLYRNNTLQRSSSHGD